MSYRRLLSLSCIGLSVCLWYLAMQQADTESTKVAVASARPVTETPYAYDQQLVAAMSAQTVHCGAVTKAHKHQLDDWILALQGEQLEHSWANYTSRLPVCLQKLAHDYMNYKQALMEIPSNLTIHERFEALQTLQGQYFSPDVLEAWFSDENRWNTQALERWQILADQSLSVQARGELINAHISQLPQDERETIVATQTLATLQQSWQTMDYNQLSARYGDEAAERLMQARSTRTNWEQRLADYKQRRAELLAGYTGSDEQAEIDMLKQALFSANEQKRLAVILANNEH
ncbi:MULTISPECIES: lipase chaperone [unclassified Pseudoalteromonas]|uniref:lipase chaperone n=1 Tax=unclassified Pseudoalteromonas TaxID=194690 RepID=UPI002096FB8C|nr:lipase chaperone [Pseudoalteromonas sp. XMcav2-N]MCO7190685.1 lipase chaperone [Pseudoalteromonas sp. XMcav2-N]